MKASAVFFPVVGGGGDGGSGCRCGCGVRAATLEYFIADS